MNNNFYGEETTEIPSTSNYMRWEEGDNRFRILGSFKDKTAIQGIEYWKTVEGNRKPIRLPKNEDGTFPSVSTSELETNKFGEPDFPRYFWAMPVWNYSEKKIQILEITQKTILKGIKAYIANEKWGDPRQYDIIVNRGKEGEKTVYTVTVDPKEKLDEGILQYYKDFELDITALFRSEDPFAPSENWSEEIISDAVAAGI